MFEAYKVAVKLSLIENVTAGLLSMSSHFAHAHGQAGALQKRLDSLKIPALTGGALLGAGLAGFAILKGPYEEAKKLAQAKADWETLNLDTHKNSEVYAKASTMSHKILGTTITENIKGIQDLHSAFGDFGHAIAHADDFAKYSIAVKVANDGKSVDGLVYNTVKALEHRGAKVIGNEAAFKDELEMQSRVAMFTKARVTGNDFFHASQTGKMAYTLYDKEFLYGTMAAYIQAKSGLTAGTAGMTAFSSLVGGHIDKKGKGFLADLGLWQEGGSKARLGIINKSLAGMSPEERKTALAVMGGEAGLAGGLKDGLAEQFSTRPDLFVKDVLVPAIHKRFGMDLSDEKVAFLLAKNFNRNTGDFLGEMVINRVKFAKDSALIKGTMGFTQSYDHYMKTPEGAEEAAHAAWENFLAVFGSIYLPQITKGLLKLADILDKTAKAVERHPTIFGLLVKAIAGLSIAGVVVGGLLLFNVVMAGMSIALAAGAVGGVAKSLIGVSGALKGLGVMAAWFIGDAVGTYIYDHMERDNQDKIGRGITKVMAAFGNEDAQYRLNTESKYIRTQQQSPTTINVPVQIDGREVASVVATHQGRMADVPQAGSSDYDGRMGMGMAGAWGY